MNSFSLAFQSSSRTSHMNCKKRCQRAHLLGCSIEQLSAHPTTCQKSSARDHSEFPCARSRFKGSTRVPSAPLKVDSPSVVYFLSFLELAKRSKTKVSLNRPPMGPKILLAKLSKCRAELDAVRYSSDFDRVVVVGCTVNVAAKARNCDGGANTFPEAVDREDITLDKRLKACVSI